MGSVDTRVACGGPMVSPEVPLLMSVATVVKSWWVGEYAVAAVVGSVDKWDMRAGGGGVVHTGGGI